MLDFFVLVLCLAAFVSLILPWVNRARLSTRKQELEQLEKAIHQQQLALAEVVRKINHLEDPQAKLSEPLATSSAAAPATPPPLPTRSAQPHITPPSPTRPHASPQAPKPIPQTLQPSSTPEPAAAASATPVATAPGTKEPAM